MGFFSTVLGFFGFGWGITLILVIGSTYKSSPSPPTSSKISKLVMTMTTPQRPQSTTKRRTQNCIEGSSIFKDLSSAMRSLGKIGITDTSDIMDKLLVYCSSK
ncbi:uncharacterized protein LOC121984375 isoform X1 [Zingiber officinale]|uniref:uncharacterized protein LOC121980466 isoform X1 n=1 Tax=Zingiber officinale TaxID=94328 RepID=UPI001C4D740E|nr:uncharacterized protein LOC121980466 isoform X1 [Zingiber officinale]XP_042393211.1 uncharacterized protein LOC121984375 isoform X1 [Zingiber officinale]